MFRLTAPCTREWNVMYKMKTLNTFLNKTEHVDVFLNKISTANFFTFNGVIADYLPLAATPAFILEHPDGHTFTICTACERFGPDLEFCEGRGGKDKPSSNHIILLLALMSQLEF